MAQERLWEIGGFPVVLAHRGGGNEAHENSIIAFRQAYEKGIRHIETDAHLTKDGVVVLHHDPILDRTTDGHGLISNHTWAELKEIYDKSGNHMVRLDAALKEFPDVIFNIDAKNNRVVRGLARTIKTAGATDRVSLASFSEARLKVLRRLLPGVRSSLGMGAIGALMIASLLPHALRGFFLKTVPGPRRGVEAVQVPVIFHGIPVVRPRFIDTAHFHGLAVHVWTVNDADTMHQLLDQGVDGIVTDEPTLARQVIALRGGELDF